jgi:hypothetical protein
MLHHVRYLSLFTNGFNVCNGSVASTLWLLRLCTVLKVCEVNARWGEDQWSLIAVDDINRMIGDVL